MDRRAVAYAAITLAPVPLLGAGALGAGAALWAGLALLAVAVPIADALAPQDRAGPMEPGGDALSLVLGGLHFPVLALGVHAVAGLPAPQAAAAFLGFGLWLGQGVVGRRAAERGLRRSLELQLAGVAGTGKRPPRRRRDSAAGARRKGGAAGTGGRGRRLEGASK